MKKAIPLPILTLSCPLPALCLASAASAADAPALAWQRCPGGGEREDGYAVEQTADGGAIIAGEAESSDGDVSGNLGGWDVWVLELDAAGALSWQRCLGGDSSDGAGDVLESADGGDVAAGYTITVSNGDVAGYHESSAIRVVKPGSGSAVQVSPGATLPPTDTDGDGIHDDVNGNGRGDFADVVLYFDQRTWTAGNEPLEGFDCNDDGRIDFADLNRLFNHP